MQQSEEPPKSLVAARIPADWAMELRDLSEELGCTQTELINEAISQYLDHPMLKFVDRLTALEEMIKLNNSAEIIQRLDTLEHMMQQLINHLKQLQPPAPTERVTVVESISASEYAGGITQTELCKRMGIPPGSLVGIAKRQGQTPQTYLENLTGWRYRVPPGRTLGRWHPPRSQTPESPELAT